VGASAGAIGALGEVLPALPAGTRWPVLVVVHLPANQPSLLGSLFARKCSVPVRDAEDKAPIAPGVWFAPPDYHLLVSADGTFGLSIDPPVNHSRPSIDVLFESAADHYGEGLVALVLTGANSDGAAGARAVREAGGFVIVQDPATAESPAMPGFAIEKARPQWVAPLNDIASALREAALHRLP
jgi:two-component system chemotaxis response regulator CheB